MLRVGDYLRDTIECIYLTYTVFTENISVCIDDPIFSYLAKEVYMYKKNTD